MANIKVILGTMTMGGTLNEEESHKMIKEFVDMGNSELDTAILYQNGKTEEIIGSFDLCRDSKKVQIGCKVNKFVGFTAEKVVEQLNTSLKNLQISSCDILYLHWPNNSVPIEETLKGVDQLYKEGKFKEFGLSNYPAWQVVNIYHICKEKGYVKPTVLQEMYNPLCRDLEVELIPAMRYCGMRLNVYSPLAAGLLSGKYDVTKPDEEQAPGRLFGHSEPDAINDFSKILQGLYWQPRMKKGLTIMQEAVNKTYDGKVSLIEASLRWLRHHSKLIDGDGIIIGCSKFHHLKSNVMACKNDEPLHEDVVKAFDEGWNVIDSMCPTFTKTLAKKFSV